MDGRTLSAIENQDFVLFAKQCSTLVPIMEKEEQLKWMHCSTEEHKRSRLPSV